ncbi:hypothetical protein HG531_013439 [Fusarium graminearum]|nr:hypothetical protein HG531_013439 [Fusarium graminearum]
MPGIDRLFQQQAEYSLSRKIRPWSQKFIVDVVYNAVEVETGKGTDELTLEPSLDLENVADNGRYGALTRRALVYYVENRNLAHAGFIPLRLAGVVPSRNIPQCAHTIPFNLGEFLLGLQLKDSNTIPWFQLIDFLAWRRVRLVHHACAQLEEGLDASLRCLLAYCNGEVQRPQLVNLILLRISRLATTVEDIIPLLSVGSAGIGLHKFVLGTGFRELRSQPCQLRENLVDKSNVGGEVILVYMEGQEAADIAEPSNDQDRRLLGHGHEGADVSTSAAQKQLVGRRSSNKQRVSISNI